LNIRKIVLVKYHPIIRMQYQCIQEVLIFEEFFESLYVLMGYYIQ